MHGNFGSIGWHLSIDKIKHRSSTSCSRKQGITLNLTSTCILYHTLINSIHNMKLLLQCVVQKHNIIGSIADVFLNLKRNLI